MATSAYIALLRHLVARNAVCAEQLEQLLTLLETNTVVNPVSTFDLRLTREEKCAFGQAFGPEIDCYAARLVACELLDKVTENSARRERAREATKNLPICLGWVDLKRLIKLLQG